MEVYNKHDDLITNFFALIEVIGNYISTKIYDPVIYNKIEFIEPTKFETNRYNEARRELKEVLPIIKEKYCISKTESNTNYFEDCSIINVPECSILNEYNHLLISLYFYKNWRLLIKDEIEKELKKYSFIFIKKRIRTSLKELQYRSGVFFIWIIEDDLYTWKELFNDSIIDLHFGCHFHNYNIIEEEIKWIDTLKEENVKKSKIIIHHKASKQKLINGINKMLDEGLLNEKGDSEELKKHKNEIKKFILYIVQKDNETIHNNSSTFNLDFINKPKLFFQVFWHCSSLNNRTKDNFILTQKTNLAQIFADVLHKEKRDSFSRSTLIRESQLEKGDVYNICNSHILHEFNSTNDK